MKRKYREEREISQSKQEDQFKELKDFFLVEKGRLKSQISQNIDNHNRKHNQLLQENEEKVAEMQKEHEEELEKLQSQLQEEQYQFQQYLDQIDQERQNKYSKSE